MKEIQTAQQRLAELPEVFSMNDLATQSGLEPKQARIYAWRWAQADLIKPAGPRAGVYFNLVRNPKAAEDLLPLAVQRLFPSAIVLGPSVLHAAQVITQIPNKLFVGVLTRRSFPEIYGAEILARPKTWFTKTKKYRGDDLFGLPALSAEAALADARVYADCWIPEEDDIDEDEIDLEQVSVIEYKIAVGARPKMSGRDARLQSMRIA